MKKRKKENSLPDILPAIIDAAENKKGQNILCLDLRKLPNAFTDFFVIADGNSNIHVETIASHIIEEIEKKLSLSPWHKEGFNNAEWIILDYADVVVHIFQRPIREFYSLETLWGDADIVKINKKITIKKARKKNIVHE